MNTTQKILELRSKGYGYKSIATELNLTRDQVRNTCNKKERTPLEVVCKNCGKKVNSITGKKKKVYCSDKCRYQWWNKQRKLKKLYEKD